VYWDARPGAKPEAMRFAGATLEEWRARGHDRRSRLADPRLRLGNDGAVEWDGRSPALEIGFRPFDLRRVGPER
jgi:hypothetical protein